MSPRRIAVPKAAAIAATLPTLLTLVAISGCATPRYVYSAPAGVSPQQLEADHRACIEESGIERLGDDQKMLEQQCMMTRGYLMRGA